MPKYLVEAHYTAEGAAGLAREGGSARRVAVARTAESAGGKPEAIYFAFGDVDAYMIIDLPDNATAAAVSLTANRTGFVESKTIVHMTADEMDQATKKTVEFRPQADDAIPVSTGFDERYALLSNDGQAY
jgi:uncharacterized protein with GYD domain